MSFTQLGAQFAPSGSLRITDLTLYNQVKADYGLGVGGEGLVLFGVSPATLVARYGVNYVDNPATSDYSNLPCVFTNTALSASQVLGQVVSAAADGINSLVAAYTDPNGQAFTSVTWEWQIEVVHYQVLDSSTFTAEVVTWTGDGTTNRQITTGADLTKGVTAILIVPAFEMPTLATSLMVAAGKFATYSAAPASTHGGVIAMNATGFRISDYAIDTVAVNTNTAKYTALVFNDSIGARLAVGSYLGTGGASHTEAAPFIPTMVWVAGRQGTMTYADTDHMPAGSSLAWSSAEAKSLTTGILSFGQGFTVGTDSNVNSGLLTYYWVAFSFNAADTIRNFFNTYKLTGTAAAIDHVTGLGFTPVFAFARPYVAGAPNAVTRSPWSVGTASLFTSVFILASGGIESFGVGDIGIGDTVAPNGTDVYGFALATLGSSNQAAQLSWIKETTVINPDGTTSTVQTVVRSYTSPGAAYTPYNPGSSTVTPTLQWWCNAALGRSVFQITSPGAGWAACAGPATKNGWYLSTEGFGGQETVVSGGTPANPRAWADIATWATGNTGMLGGSPGAACVTDNVMVYPGSGYVVGTAYPPVRAYNGRSDREMCKLPPTTANVVPKAVMSMLAANGAVYLSSWDSGTTSADWTGRVFALDVATGILTALGTAFAAGEMPYALAWHMGRLWCGTNNGIGTVGKIYYFRPGIDTAWTLDHATSTDSAGGVDSMVSYKGKLYVGTDNAAASRGKVLVRDTAGAYTVSLTGTGGTAVVNNGYLALTVFGDNLYASYWNNDTTAVAKIEKYTGSAWSTAYTGATTTLRPFIQLVVDAGALYAVGGGKLLSAALLVSTTGSVWSDLTVELPETDTTLLPMFGAVVM